MLVASQVAAGKPSILHWPDLSHEQRIRRHGSGVHSTIESLTVGETTTVTFEFTVGDEPVRTGGRLLVVWRWPFDWGDLQTTAPSAEGYLTAEHRPIENRVAVELKCKYNWIAGIEPWHHQLQVQVAGELRSGDVVRLVCGETTHGGGGWRIPTCVADRCRFLMLIDHQGDGRRNRLVPTPSFRTLATELAQLQVVAPSDATVGDDVEVIVRGDDCWGNPASLPASIDVGTTSTSVPPQRIERNTLRPVQSYHVRFDAPGIHHVHAGSNDPALEATSNPITVHPSPPPLRLFWGDLHSGQTEIGCGCGSLSDHYAFARDCAGLTFTTHQANDHYVTQPEWKQTREVTEQFYEPGRFVPILGCEWSPLTKDGGDRNVFYGDDDPVLRRSDRFFIEQPVDETPDIPTAPDFHDAFRDRNVLVNIHVGGRMTNLQWYEPAIERLCETHSTHGTVEWFFMDAIARGYKVGLTAGTDGVMGRPGSCQPGRRLIRNCSNGLTAVFCRELTREAIWQALQNRHCYATTGQRIRLHVSLDGHLMGADYRPATHEMKLHVEVQGTAAIERIELFRDVACIKSWSVAPPVTDLKRFRLLWGGTERKGTARLQQVLWDGCVRMDDGKIQLLRSINFQSVDDRAWQESSNEVAWTSKTAGNTAGIEVSLDSDNPQAQVTFVTDILEKSVSVQELAAGLHVECGGVGRFVCLEPARRDDAEKSFALEHDLPAQPGAYWIRVTQVDQAKAWSSPIYCA